MLPWATSRILQACNTVLKSCIWLLFKTLSLFGQEPKEALFIRSSLQLYFSFAFCESWTQNALLLIITHQLMTRQDYSFEAAIQCFFSAVFLYRCLRVVNSNSSFLVDLERLMKISLFGEQLYLLFRRFKASLAALQRCLCINTAASCELSCIY